jgi:uncharacterized protein (DUF433 family)/PHD/YefM family antitoxin component YafN of YafNO toxin-antitoxin module
VRDGATGEAVIGGTGITVADVLRQLAGGPCAEDVLRAHPGLTQAGLAAALSFATEAVRREARYDAPRPAAEPARVRERAVLAPVDDRSRSVVLSEEEYADLLDELELLRELNNAQSEVAAGETVSQEEAIAYLRSRFGG